jgi:hypothetical protein
MDNGKFGSNGLPMFLASFWNEDSLGPNQPIRSPKPFYAAGFLFLDASFLYEVPYDPNVSHLF